MFTNGDKVTVSYGGVKHDAIFIGVGVPEGWLVCAREDGRMWEHANSVYDGYLPAFVTPRALTPEQTVQNLMFDYDGNDFDGTFAEGFCDVCPGTGCDGCRDAVAFAIALDLYEQGVASCK